MKFRVDDLVEQGTAQGVMRFRPGVDYGVDVIGDALRIAHEPRAAIRRVPDPQDSSKKVRQSVVETVTEVPRAIIEKMVKLGVAQLIEE